MRHSSTTIRLEQWLSLAAAAVCLGLLATGCRSASGSHHGPAPLAVIEIPGNTPGQIRAVAVEVFQAHGYQPVRLEPNEWVFDKPGTKWNNLAYGGWVDDPTVLRVKVSLSITGQTDCRVECRGYVVRDKGGATEEELHDSLMRRKPCQQLLNEIASRFHHPG